jgi:hypothetical protein
LHTLSTTSQSPIRQTQPVAMSSQALPQTGWILQKKSFEDALCYRGKVLYHAPDRVLYSITSSVYGKSSIVGYRRPCIILNVFRVDRVGEATVRFVPLTSSNKHDESRFSKEVKLILPLPDEQYSHHSWDRVLWHGGVLLSVSPWTTVTFLLLQLLSTSCATTIVRNGQVLEMEEILSISTGIITQTTSQSPVIYGSEMGDFQCKYIELSYKLQYYIPISIYIPQVEAIEMAFQLGITLPS